jgi:hypothetical protein
LQSAWNSEKIIVYDLPIIIINSKFIINSKAKRKYIVQKFAIWGREMIKNVILLMKFIFKKTLQNAGGKFTMKI